MRILRSSKTLRPPLFRAVRQWQGRLEPPGATAPQQGATTTSPASALAHMPCCHTSRRAMRWPQGCYTLAPAPGQRCINCCQILAAGLPGVVPVETLHSCQGRRERTSFHNASPTKHHTFVFLVYNAQCLRVQKYTNQPRRSKKQLQDASSTFLRQATWCSNKRTKRQARTG